MATTQVTFVTGLKSPDGKDGEFPADVGNNRMKVTLRFEKGRVVDVISPGNMVMAMSGNFPETLVDVSTGITTCFKCATDSTTGHVVCWDVPC